MTAFSLLRSPLLRSLLLLILVAATDTRAILYLAACLGRRVLFSRSMWCRG